MATPHRELATALAHLRTPIVPGESEAYAAAREALLATETEARRVLTDLAGQRRALPPGPLVRKDYRFRDVEGHELTLRDLFGGHATLITYFWMYGPERDGDDVRVFYAAEMPAEAADPGQDPRGATDLSPLWNLLDHTPEGRGEDWYPKLSYPA